MEFAQLNQITLELSNSGTKSKRKRQEPHHLQSYNLETLTGQQSESECRTIDNEHWKIIYFQIIDSVIVNLKYRFSDESLVLANSLDKFMKMNFEKGSYFINHYKVS
ncbi:uncharacterized protein LOC111038644 [Myzus persicae]|uniref:uncharacterized protein LOC111038644 n=1 Tax=Myzus persicae TaxID=13164 RepID=UPI000B934E7E|nr:uncharacterized protein LOC111038644 [Myzus persicae]